MDDYKNTDQNGYQNGYQTNDWGQQGYYQNYQQKIFIRMETAITRNSRKQNLEEPMSVGEWILVMLITAIPCVNIIMLFVGFWKNGTKKSKTNWARAFDFSLDWSCDRGAVCSIRSKSNS